MKVFFLLLFFSAQAFIVSNAQDTRTGSLEQLPGNAPPDTNRVKLLLQRAETYYFSKPDTCLVFAEKALDLARELNFTRGQVSALNTAGEALRFLGNYPQALKMQFEALQINRKMKDLAGEATSLGFIGLIYVEFREYRKGLEYLRPASKLDKQMSNQIMESFHTTNIGNAYDLLGMPDSALYYQQQAYKTYTGLKHGPLKSLILTRLGNAYMGLGKKDSALAYYRIALMNSILVNGKVNISKIHLKIAELYESTQQIDSSLYYARRAFENGKQSAQRLELLETSELLVNLFRKKESTDSAFFYQDFAKAMTDSLYGPEKFKQLQLLMLDEQQQQQKIKQEQVRFSNRIKYAALLSALAIFLSLALILFRNNRHKQRANSLLQQQKNKIEETLSELRSTQSQLVQREKMASLGELTAGIAHEIQNPLNFVNNFSEVSNELIDEMNTELNRGDIQEAKAIAADVRQNLEKINYHGKRADAIVKGMLQHSRSSSGVKEPTDINALCDEYLRLSYHGLRAKDKSFNATMKTDFDETIGDINIIPQDIGRVLLNLYNNAFYAACLPPPVGGGFKDRYYKHEPTVWVSTKKSGNKIVISVRDNGPGIPQKIIDKIFQPFFTTKPTGQGTGLGLSLAYDIVKAHGGELKVETKEGEGTTFITTL
ncbi:MAG: ATP-binding protein [Chitinophagaceae bacterium]